MSTVSLYLDKILNYLFTIEDYFFNAEFSLVIYTKAIAPRWLCVSWGVPPQKWTESWVIILWSNWVSEQAEHRQVLWFEVLLQAEPAFGCLPTTRWKMCMWKGSPRPGSLLSCAQHSHSPLWHTVEVMGAMGPAEVQKTAWPKALHTSIFQGKRKFFMKKPTPSARRIKRPKSWRTWDTPTSRVRWIMCSWQSLLPGCDVKSKRNKAMEEASWRLWHCGHHTQCCPAGRRGSQKGGGTRATFGLTWVRD